MRRKWARATFGSLSMLVRGDAVIVNQPSDLRIVAATPDYARELVVFVVESSEFPDVDQGDQCMEHDCLMKKTPRPSEAQVGGGGNPS